MANKDAVLEELIHVGVIKKGKFTLKSGNKSDIYFDFRELASYPTLMDKICDLLIEEVRNERVDLLVGLPYASIPIASVLSVKTDIPMIYPRKERKQYGTKKKIEGVYSTGQSCAIIDDVISSGDSKLETINNLREANLVPKVIVVLVDRGEGGKQKIEKLGIRMKSLWSLEDF